MHLEGKKYQIIYADPPWQYRDRGSSGKRGSCYKYRVQSDNWLKYFGSEVVQLADTNCSLLLWAVSPKLPDALEVMKHWGFTYKTIAFVWAKRSRTGKCWHIGMGNWTRANSEVCLLGTRGSPKRASRSVRQLVVDPVREHSRKPDLVRERIVELFGDIPRIELFARGVYPGWDLLGDQLDCFTGN